MDPGNLLFLQRDVTDACPFSAARCKGGRSEGHESSARLGEAANGSMGKLSSKV